MASESSRTPVASPPYTLIRDLPLGDRPRERLRDFGAAALTTYELLAILLRVGSAKESAVAQANRLLRDFHGLEGLRRASFGELAGARGVGEAKAAQVHAGFELGARLVSTAVADRPAIASPEDTADLVLADMSPLAQEELWVLQLDSRNHLLSKVKLYRGSVHTTQVRMGEVFRDAIRLTAVAVVVVHNHPSGDPTPSANDVTMTKMLREAGRLLDIEVIDHIVIGGGRYVSMRNLRLGFET
jgi:DNA repair protein RadC